MEKIEIIKKKPKKKKKKKSTSSAGDSKKWHTCSWWQLWSHGAAVGPLLSQNTKRTHAQEPTSHKVHFSSFSRGTLR